MKFYLLLQLVVASCIAGDDHGIETADVYKVYEQDKAMLLAETRFEQYYGVESTAFEWAEVQWTNTPCPYKNAWAVVYQDKCFYGITWDCDEIYVALNKDEPNRTCPTALMHEFGHCLRLDAGWDGDADHSEVEFWDFIGVVRKETCERDW